MLDGFPLGLRSRDHSRETTDLQERLSGFCVAHFVLSLAANIARTCSVVRLPIRRLRSFNTPSTQGASWLMTSCAIRTHRAVCMFISECMFVLLSRSM